MVMDSIEFHRFLLIIDKTTGNYQTLPDLKESNW